MQAAEGLELDTAELSRDDNHSEAQPLSARTSLHPWVSPGAPDGGRLGPGIGEQGRGLCAQGQP